MKYFIKFFATALVLFNSQVCLASPNPLGGLEGLWIILLILLVIVLGLVGLIVKLLISAFKKPKASNDDSESNN